MTVVRFINNPSSLQLEGFRSIKAITLGPYWMPAPAHNTYFLRQQTFQYRRGSPSIILAAHTQPMPPAQADALRDCLISGTHDVTEAEWQTLAGVFGEQADHNEFILKSSEVLDWNGKLCILNRGDFPEFNLRTYNLFIDAMNDGQYLEEVIYQAPIEQFESCFNDALISLQSIDWLTPNPF